jgi:DNA-binding transcriptional ArsR family regulator
VTAADPLEDPLDHLFDALSDPTRRRLFTRLVQDGPDTATRLSAGLPVSRQAVVKHLQALAEAGLATPERSGREVRYRANAAPLTTAVGWLVEAGARWDRRLARLERVAREQGSSADDGADSPRTLADRGGD